MISLSACLWFSMLATPQGPEALAGVDSWEVYRTEEGRFSIRMPGEVEQVRRSLEQKSGPVEMVMHYATEGKDVYMVSVNPTSADVSTTAKLRQVLEGAHQGMLKSRIKPRMTSSQFVKSAAGPSALDVSFWADGEDGEATQTRWRGLIHKGSLFQLIVMRPKGSADSARVKAFFDSFRVLGDR